MPTKPLSNDEVDGIDHLVRIATQYLEHPDVIVQDVGSETIARKLQATWGFIWPGRAPTKATAAKFSFAAQQAADVLSRPAVTRVPFALPAANMSRELREVVRRMKAFRK
jgi:hypothetical protein